MRALALLAALVWAAPAGAQTVSGLVFEDRNADGIHDPGEPFLDGVQVRLFGTQGGTTPLDQTTSSAVDGTFSLAPGDGCYLLAPQDPPGFRPTAARRDGFPQSTPGYDQPVGQPRFAKLDHAIDSLLSGGLRYSALGDSIAANFNVFCGGSSFEYSQTLRSRLECVAPPGIVPTLDQGAQLGETTDDLLVDETNNFNNVFRVIDAQSELVSISIIGNDLLGVDPGDGGTQNDVDRAATEVLDARQNLQEILSAILTEVPDADVILNTLYDNEAFACNPTNFHAAWIPIVNRILRDVAWGQVRRVSIAEIAPEFARLDLAGGCPGFQNLICNNVFDGIHPTGAGYDVIAEKLWEGAGGVQLGTADALGRTSIGSVGYGYLRRVRRLLPLGWETRGGALVTTPEAALDDADGGAAASIRLGNGDQEFRVVGFPEWFDEIQIARVIAGVRYRTAGPGQPVDDLYRIEASVDDTFRAPPGHAYAPTDWNFYTPIVGGGGPGRPPLNPDFPNLPTLVVPAVPQFREVSATLTKNPILPPGAADYVWPAVTHEELATTAIRVAAAPDPGAQGDDGYTVELDDAWLDLYGWEKPRPGEVQELRLARQAGGTLLLSFEPLAGAARYNAYQGRLATLRTAAGYDHGSSAPAGPDCDATTAPAAGARLQISLSSGQQASGDTYFLVTGHVDDVESPAGRNSQAVEIDRAQSVCR